MADSECTRLSCADCGVFFERPLGRGRTPKRCVECRGVARGLEKQDAIKYVAAPCQHCGQLMPPRAPSKLKKFCSIACVGKSQRLAPVTACEECGTHFQRRAGGCELREGRKPSYCSRGCYAKALSRRRIGVAVVPGPEVLERRRTQAAEKAAAKAAEKRRRKEERAAIAAASAADRKAKADAKRSIRACLGCGALMGVAPFSRWCCTEKCRDDVARHGRRKSKAQYRARLKNATIEKFLDVEIFRRDGWRCQICGAPTPESRIGTNHPKAPTLDHVVALANGGDHARANVQCACRACNSIKADGPPQGQIGIWATVQAS